MNDENEKWTTREDVANGEKVFIANSPGIIINKGVSMIHYNVRKNHPDQINLIFGNMHVKGSRENDISGQHFRFKIRFDDEESIITFQAEVIDKDTFVYSVVPSHNSIMRLNLSNSKVFSLYTSTPQDGTIWLDYSLKNAKQAISFVRSKARFSD